MKSSLGPTRRRAAARNRPILRGIGGYPALTAACGAGNEEAGQRALASLRFMGDALFTTAEEIGKILRERTGAATTK